MITFHGGSVWQSLTKAAQSSHRRVRAAVAYIGTGASELLPLPAGSRLVVDASEASVRQGRTNPKELTKMLARGVQVFSVDNLHAKVFVIGQTAWVGSANVSQRSKRELVEAVMATTEPESVRQAREFIDRLCLNELGPSELERLASIYRPPKFAGPRTMGKRKKSNRVAPVLPRMVIAQLVRMDFHEAAEAAAEKGERGAREKMEHPRKHALSHYGWRWNCPHKPGDVVLQIVKESDGSRMVSPPGTVLNTKRWHSGPAKGSIVFVELPQRNCKSLDRLAKQIGYGAKKRLLRGGPVQQDFAEQVFRAFSRRKQTQNADD